MDWDADISRYTAEADLAKAQRRSAKLRQRYDWKGWPILTKEERLKRQQLSQSAQDDGMMQSPPKQYSWVRYDVS
jgi:hypothetical protein